MRLKFFPLLLSILSVQFALAQDAKGSKVKVQFVNGYWMVDFKTDNVSAMNALSIENAAFNPSEMGNDGLEKAYRSYLKNSFSLKVDTSLINVKFVSSEINSAKANAQFISARFEESGGMVTVKSTAFSNLDNHPIKLIIKIRDEKHVRWLTEDNAYECQVNLTEKNE